LKKKRAYVVACAVLALDLKRIAASQELDFGTRFLPGGLHNDPDLLRQNLQDAIDDISRKDDCERVIVGYGVCGRGSVPGTFPWPSPRFMTALPFFWAVTVFTNASSKSTRVPTTSRPAGTRRRPSPFPSRKNPPITGTNVCTMMTLWKLTAGKRLKKPYGF